MSRNGLAWIEIKMEMEMEVEVEVEVNADVDVGVDMEGFYFLGKLIGHGMAKEFSHNHRQI